jgi:hypothetical protein
MWMNEHEVGQAEAEYAGHPVLGPATQTLASLVNGVNRCSDGWPYWQSPRRAADRLMNLIIGHQTWERTEYQHPRDGAEATADRLKAAYAALRRFRTTRGNAAGCHFTIHGAPGVPGDPGMTPEPGPAGGDRPVVTLAPDAHLVIDASGCIVLVTPDRRITVTNVAGWQEGLGLARQFQQIYNDDAEQARGRALAELHQQHHVARGQLHRKSRAWRALDDAARGDVVARLIAAWQAAETQLDFAEFAEHWAIGYEKQEVPGDAR